MSFSRNSKVEILQTMSLEDDTTALAFLSGLFRSCGQIEKKNGKLFFKIVSDVKELFGFVNNILTKFFGAQVSPEVAENYNIHKNTDYEISFEVESFKNMLLDVGVVDLEDGELRLKFELDQNLLLEDEARRAFLRGAYIGASTSSIKLSEGVAQSCGSGYHMEFSSQSHQFLTDLSHLLAQYNVIGTFGREQRRFGAFERNGDARTSQQGQPPSELHNSKHQQDGGSEP